MTILEHIKKLESGNIDEREKQIFNFVLKACNQFSPKKVIARIAGGWVRDRVLGKPSSDVDLAIEGVDCEEFGQILLKEAGINSKEKIVVIAANPEMSKHMKTVRVCIFPKFWIDICNLRPADMDSTEEGTAESDAKRRDFTINALFFNINTNKVEDLVGGIEDLENKKIRTPTDPTITFSEDPLRIVRCIRFAAKYQFQVDQSIIDSIPQIKEKFQNNVTRERITTELLKAFESLSSSKIALDLIFKMNFFMPIFNPNNEIQISEKLAFDRTQIALSRCKNDDQIFDIILCAIYYDLPSMGKMSDPLKPNKKIDPVDYVIVRQMKIPAKDSDFISNLLQSEKTLQTIPNDLSRLSVGHWIRAIKTNWPFTRCIIFDDNLLSFFDNVLVKFIKDEKMEELINMKPLFNGKQLAEKHNIKPGPQLKKYVDQLVDWQIMNPNGKASDYDNYIQSL